MRRDRDLDYGFQFNYNNHRIGRSDRLNETQMDILGDAGSNSAGMYVQCSSCGQYMNFEEGTNGGFGRWICPSCGTKVRELTAYNQLGRENEKETMKWNDDTVPEGCAACGGPWPSCQTSCSMYDD